MSTYFGATKQCKEPDSSICMSSVKMPSIYLKYNMPAVNIQGMYCGVYLNFAVAAAASLRKKSR